MPGAVLGQLGQVGFADQVAGDADEVVAVDVERHVAHAFRESPADDVDRGLRVAHDGVVKVQNVAHAGRKQLVQRRNREQMRAVLQLAAEGKIRTVVERFPMEQAEEALVRLANGELRSRAVVYNTGE